MKKGSNGYKAGVLIFKRGLMGSTIRYIVTNLAMFENYYILYQFGTEKCTKKAEPVHFSIYNTILPQISTSFTTYLVLLGDMQNLDINKYWVSKLMPSSVIFFLDSDHDPFPVLEKYNEY